MKYKLFVLVLFCFLLCGCGNYRELNDLSIVTGIGIDYKDDKYVLSYLIANAQKSQTSSKEGEAKTTVYSGKGKNLSEAARRIESKSARSLYYGHVNVVIISEEVSKKGVFNVADFILRNPETRKQFYILQAKDCESEDVLKIISPLESFPSQGISSLIKSNQNDQAFSADVNYSLFISRILDKGYEAVIPSITIRGSTKKGSSEKNLETTEPNTYLKLGPLAIYRDDKFIDYSSEKESMGINILMNQVNEFQYTFKDNDSYIGFSSDNIKSSIKVKNNIANVVVSGSGFISEINGKYNLENDKIIKKLEKRLNSSLKKDLFKTIYSLQNDYKSDVLGIGNMIYKKDSKVWNKTHDNWSTFGFKNVNFNVKVMLKINSSGALEQTIKEVYDEKD